MPILNMITAGGGGGGGGFIGEPSDLLLSGDGSTVTITWNDNDLNSIPSSSFSRSVLVRKTGSAPTSPSDGTVVVTETTKNTYTTVGYEDTGLSYNATYYYRVYSYSNDGGITYCDAKSIIPTENDMFYLQAEQAGSTVSLKKYGSPTSVTIEKSTDGETWSSYSLGSNVTLTNVGDKVYFRNASTTVTGFSLGEYKYYYFAMTGRITANGSLNYLLCKSGTSTLAASTSYCFCKLFTNCSALIKAPKLPATTLKSYCYYYMFQNCTELAVLPKLSATTLAECCYGHMFYGCTSLTATPALPATTLQTYCYSYMFQGCTNLRTINNISATRIATRCYAGMFQNCTSLTTAPTLPFTTLATRCYSGMFKGCTSLTTPPALPATTLAEYCYQNMFQDCTALTSLPELSVTTLASSCCNTMFSGCTNIKISATQTGEYQTPYRIPSTGRATFSDVWNASMLENTGGTYKSSPTLNITYYTSNTIVPAR